MKNYLLSKIPQLMQKAPASSVDTLTQLSELPYHVLSKMKGEFNGTLGKKNLLHGLMAGSGAAGTSILGDKATGQDTNKTRASILGVLGAISPAAFMAGRSGYRGGREFIEAIKSLTDRGVNAMALPTKLKKELIISQVLRGLKEDPSKLLSTARKDKNFRSELMSVFKPDNTIAIDYLTNAKGGLEAIAPHMTNLARNFGKTTVDAGTIINPNIARAVSSGALPSKLKGMGFSKFTGETRETKNLGPELANAIRHHFSKLVKKDIPGAAEAQAAPNFGAMSPAELKAYLPNHNKSFFPMQYEHPSLGKIKLTAGRKKLTGDMEGEFEPSLGWKDLSPEIKQWLRSQNISGPRDYVTMNDQVATFFNHAKNVAKKNPQEFLTDFKVPGLKTIFKNDRPINFNVDLSKV